MKDANFNMRIDARLKQEAESIFDELGLNMSTAITIFLKQVVQRNGLPFEVKLKIPNAETRQVLEDSLAGKNLSGPFSTIEEMWEHINAED